MHRLAAMFLLQMHFPAIGGFYNLLRFVSSTANKVFNKISIFFFAFHAKFHGSQRIELRSHYFHFCGETRRQNSNNEHVLIMKSGVCTVFWVHHDSIETFLHDFWFRGWESLKIILLISSFLKLLAAFDISTRLHELIFCHRASSKLNLWRTKRRRELKTIYLFMFFRQLNCELQSWLRQSENENGCEQRRWGGLRWQVDKTSLMTTWSLDLCLRQRSSVDHQKFNAQFLLIAIAVLSLQFIQIQIFM